MTATRDHYLEAFTREADQVYPAMDRIEIGRIALDGPRLLRAAQVLACPVKVHPPNWQHGRLIYAIAREYLERAVRVQADPVLLLDIGTAKGFSALCLAWALTDAHARGLVVSVDVVDPLARVPRNSVADLDTPLATVPELLRAWPGAERIACVQSTGLVWLARHRERVHLAFIDGKHDHETVAAEGRILRDRQLTGDVILFDDLQIPGVATAVRTLAGYTVSTVSLSPQADRAYAVAVRS